MKPKTVLVCGLPGAGKTYFAKMLAYTLDDSARYYNADEVRKAFNDWDFSDEGRKRQAERMKGMAEKAHADGKHVILDFVCPKQEYRDLIDADILVWANRTPVRDFPDTTAMFEKPIEWDHELTDEDTEWDTEHNLMCIEQALHEYNEARPTALMIGRYQPWHDGHTALFKKALEKHGQVCIAVRTMRTGPKNPFVWSEVADRIEEALVGYEGQYTIIQIPNIVDVVYGRDVGWTVSKIDLPEDIEAISATKIREAMKNENPKT